MLHTRSKTLKGCVAMSVQDELERIGDGLDFSGLETRLDRLADILDDKPPLDLVAIRACIMQQVTCTVFPLEDKCVPPKSFELRCTLVADPTFECGKPALYWNGIIFLHPQQYALLQSTHHSVLARHFRKNTDMDGVDAVYSTEVSSMDCGDRCINVLLNLEIEFGVRCYLGHNVCDVARAGFNRNAMNAVDSDNFCDTKTGAECQLPCCGKRVACTKHAPFPVPTVATVFCAYHEDYDARMKRARTGDDE